MSVNPRKPSPAEARRKAEAARREAAPKPIPPDADTQRKIDEFKARRQEVAKKGTARPTPLPDRRGRPGPPTPDQARRAQAAKNQANADDSRYGKGGKGMSPRTRPAWTRPKPPDRNQVGVDGRTGTPSSRLFDPMTDKAPPPGGWKA